MKQSKLLKTLCFLFLISVFLQGCVNPIATRIHPTGQPHSVWSTKDGTVSFRIGADKIDPVYGSIETDNSSVEIRIRTAIQVDVVEFYYAEDMPNVDSNYPLDRFAYGYSKTISKKEFQIEIKSADAFFESGQILTFYRLSP